MNTTVSYDVTNCTIIRDGAAEYGKTVKVRGGKIAAIENSPGGSGPSVTSYDAEGHWLVPGFVELHIHGCGDLSLEQETPAGQMLHRMCRALAERGVNTFLPTLQANEAAIARLGGELAGVGGGGAGELRERIPGLYIEGPFVHPDKRGGILEGHIAEPGPGLIRRLQDTARGTIKMMTIAPELPGADKLISVMDDEGIVPCFGHSSAGFSEGLKAAAEYLRGSGKSVHITHLFNAMSPISHKEPGLAMLPFLDRHVTFELNGDGVHIHPDMLRFCWRHLDRKRMVLISDAVVSAGEPPGEYAYFGKEVVSGEDGVRYRDSGVLIGSHLLLPRIAAVFAGITGAGPEEIIPLVTENPLRVLGREGAPADLILIDDDFRLIHNFHPYGRSAPAP